MLVNYMCIIRLLFAVTLVYEIAVGKPGIAMI